MQVLALKFPLIIFLRLVIFGVVSGYPLSKLKLKPLIEQIAYHNVLNENIIIILV